MKKILFLMTMFTAMCFASCGNNQKAEGEVADTTVVDSVEVVDSVVADSVEVAE